MLQIIRTTLVGGIFFLIPVVVLFLLLDQAIDLISGISDPVVALLPEGFDDNPIASKVVAILILLLICFFAGLLARTELARRFESLVETRLLVNLPFYSVLKAQAGAMVESKQAALIPVLVRLDDTWQVAFEMERVAGDLVAVFIPGAPDPWSGAVAVVEAARVSEPLSLSMAAVQNLSHRLGRGMNEALAEHFRSTHPA